MVSAISAFLFALITDRAFKMVWPGPFRAEEGWDHPYIDWTVDPSSDLAKATRGVALMGDSSLPDIDGPLRRVMAREDLRGMHREEQIVRFLRTRCLLACRDSDRQRPLGGSEGWTQQEVVVVISRP